MLESLNLIHSFIITKGDNFIEISFNIPLVPYRTWRSPLRLRSLRNETLISSTQLRREAHLQQKHSTEVMVRVRSIKKVEVLDYWSCRIISSAWIVFVTAFWIGALRAYVNPMVDGE